MGVYLCWGLVLHRKVELELCGQLILRVESVREVHPPDTAVGMDLWEERTMDYI